ncbi:MAG: SemiSWEET transporter [Candidatus Izemoplasmatales bacterium]|nr:SemiSWEET transporter [bacterium]MDZ4195911.1 SemiSWEET transporter [Candidatus Izemoplasmatales bacterium]
MIDYIGVAAAFLTTISFLPQAISVVKTNKTAGISLPMYVLFSIGVVCWSIYGLARNDIPLFVANSITLVFALVVLITKIKNVIRKID